MLDKTYQPAAVEARRYALWEQSGAFACDPDGDKIPYTIMMPPPNVTGSLHIGHALNHTLQDVLVRYQRMRGRDVLWQPGTDHAGIATEIVVADQLRAQGQVKHDLGRERFGLSLASCVGLAPRPTGAANASRWIRVWRPRCAASLSNFSGRASFTATNGWLIGIRSCTR